MDGYVETSTTLTVESPSLYNLLGASCRHVLTLSFEDKGLKSCKSTQLSSNKQFVRRSHIQGPLCLWRSWVVSGSEEIIGIQGSLTKALWGPIIKPTSWMMHMDEAPHPLPRHLASSTQRLNLQVHIQVCLIPKLESQCELLWEPFKNCMFVFHCHWGWNLGAVRGQVWSEVSALDKVGWGEVTKGESKKRRGKGA